MTIVNMLTIVEYFLLGGSYQIDIGMLNDKWIKISLNVQGIILVKEVMPLVLWYFNCNV